MDRSCSVPLRHSGSESFVYWDNRMYRQQMWTEHRTKLLSERSTNVVNSVGCSDPQNGCDEDDGCVEGWLDGFVEGRSVSYKLGPRPRLPSRGKSGHGRESLTALGPARATEGQRRRDAAVDLALRVAARADREGAETDGTATGAMEPMALRLLEMATADGQQLRRDAVVDLALRVAAQSGQQEGAETRLEQWNRARWAWRWPLLMGSSGDGETQQ
jgi:hypothetical protein